MTTTHGLIATKRPTSVNEEEFYTVPSDTEVFGVLTICNQSTFQLVNYSVAHKSSVGGAGSDEWIRYLKPLSFGDSHRIPMVMRAAEAISIQASIANTVSFVFAGRVVS